jgi:hypothetical protein
MLEAKARSSTARRPLAAVLALMKERANTINELADAAMLFYREPQPDAALLDQHLTEAVKPALALFAERCKDVEWSKEALAGDDQGSAGRAHLKMPQLAMPLRLMLTGQLQTPAIDAVLELFGRETVLARLQNSKFFSKRHLQFASAVAIISLLRKRGYSSAGRALAWHARGQRFDPAYLHQVGHCEVAVKKTLFSVTVVPGPHRLEA